MAEALTPEFRLMRSPLAGLRLAVAHTQRRFDRHTHAEYGIGVLDAGGQRSGSGRGPVEAVRGQIMTVNPGEVHDGAPLQGAPRRWRMVYFAPALWELGPAMPHWLHPVMADGRLVRLFDALFDTARTACEALPVEERLVALLHHAPATAAREPERTGPGVRVFADAREQLADAGSPTPSLAALAQRAGLSRYHFLRAFAAAHGLPPHAWAQQQRLARAEHQLARGMAPAQAAVAAGFADQSHLTRAFRRFRGYTPGAYAAAQR